VNHRVSAVSLCKIKNNEELTQSYTEYACFVYGEFCSKSLIMIFKFFIVSNVSYIHL